MRAAPPVQLAVSAAGAWSRSAAVLRAAAAGCACAWALQWAEFDRVWLVAGAVSLATLVVTWRWPASDAGLLRWDGAQWTLDDRPGGVRVMIDLDGWMLLRFAGSERTSWLALGARASGPEWHALRAAVYSRAPHSEPE